jgi:capsular polysaccharide biosynthesis protein
VGQLIDLRCLAVKRSLNPIARRHQTITRGLLAFSGCPETVRCSIGAIVRSAPAITCDPQRLLSCHRTGRYGCTATGQGASVALLGYLVANRGDPSAAPGRDIACGRRIETSTRVLVSHLSRVVTSRGDLVTHLRAGARRQFLIAGNLILIRGQLITVGGRLVLI